MNAWRGSPTASGKASRPCIAKRYGGKPPGAPGYERAQEAASVEAGRVRARSARPPSSQCNGRRRGGPSQDEDSARHATRHTVKQGETVTQIAAPYGLSPAELQRANGCRRMRPCAPDSTSNCPVPWRRSGLARRGRISPVPLAGPSPPRLSGRYVVKRGDTLTEIARVHGSRKPTLRRWNGLSRDALLQPGRLSHPDLLVVATLQIRRFVSYSRVNRYVDVPLAADYIPYPSVALTADVDGAEAHF